MVPVYTVVCPLRGIPRSKWLFAVIRHRGKRGILGSSCRYLNASNLYASKSNAATPEIEAGGGPCAPEPSVRVKTVYPFIDDSESSGLRI